MPSAPAYSASKHGVVGFTRSLAAQLGAELPHLRVHCPCPSYTETALLDDVDPVAVDEQGGALPVALVAGGLVRLLTDDALPSGAVMRVTQRNGVDFHTR